MTIDPNTPHPTLLQELTDAHQPTPRQTDQRRQPITWQQAAPMALALGIAAIVGPVVAWLILTATPTGPAAVALAATVPVGLFALAYLATRITDHLERS